MDTSSINGSIGCSIHYVLVACWGVELHHISRLLLKGIVHLNIIFSYMKFNKICNLDHPVYWNYLCWFSATCISEYFVFCIITQMGDSILKTLSNLSQNGHLKGFVYYITIWLHFLFGFKSNMTQCFRYIFEQLYFRLCKYTNLNEDIYQF